jgi:hypothetical protein
LSRLNTGLDSADPGIATNSNHPGQQLVPHRHHSHGGQGRRGDQRSLPSPKPPCARPRHRHALRGPKLVKLPGWLNSAVVSTETGQVRIDNYEGSWEDQKYLDAFLQAYAIEKTKIEARKKGHSVYEQALPDGSVKLTIQVGGGS